MLAHPSNWRIQPQGQQHALASVLDEVGLVQSVVVDRTTGRLLDGHLRAELAITAGQPTILVVYVELSEEDEHIILASIDPIAAMATADREKLSKLLASIANDNLNGLLEDVARGNHLALDFAHPGLTDPDEAPEPPEEPVTKLGDLWLLGDHRLLCGDATHPEAPASPSRPRRRFCSRPSRAPWFGGSWGKLVSQEPMAGEPVSRIRRRGST